jgi:TonB family protein
VLLIVANAQSDPITQKAEPLSSPTAAAAEQPARPSSVMQAPERIRSAVVLVTVFDAAGKLLRSGTGFFVSEDGRVVTTYHTMEGAVNAVVKTADDSIYNITGLIAFSTRMDLAVLNAETRKVPFIAVSKAAVPQPRTSATVIGSALAGNEGVPVEGTILAGENEQQFQLSAHVSPITFGAPIVDANGDLIGVVTGRDEKDENMVVVRSARVVSSLLGEARSTASARWLGEPSPSPTPKIHLVFTPSPRYPLEGRFRDGLARSGRFRISFGADGNARNVQVLKSTGSDVLDRAAATGLQQWRCEPGREGFVIVPLTFQSR